MTERPKTTSTPDDSGAGRRQPDSADLATIVNRAVERFAALTAKRVDGVTGVRREDDDRWSLLVDVVELERVPSTTTVIATYRVDVDSDSELVGYERLRRYVRGAVDPR
jgi:hypothetical protein